MHIVICAWCGNAVESSEAFEIDLTSFDDFDDADDYSAVICADCAKHAFGTHTAIECWED